MGTLAKIARLMYLEDTYVAISYTLYEDEIELNCYPGVLLLVRSDSKFCQKNLQTVKCSIIVPVSASNV